MSGSVYSTARFAVKSLPIRSSRSPEPTNRMPDIRAERRIAAAAIRKLGVTSTPSRPNPIRPLCEFDLNSVVVYTPEVAERYTVVSTRSYSSWKALKCVKSSRPASRSCARS